MSRSDPSRYDALTTSNKVSYQNALNVQNMMEEVFTPIWNSIGVINGTNADETIIIGNHRDAWIIGGAGMRSRSSSISRAHTD